MSIDVTESRQRIMEFLNEKGVGVLATADQRGKPHAATVYLTFDKQLNFYFITKKETQKYHNLQANPRAAIAIFDTATQTTVQAEGLVALVTDSEQLAWIFKDIWSIASQTSGGNPPPTTQIIAGGYAAYRLSAPSLRMATFSNTQTAESATIFDVVSTQPSQ